MGLVPQDPPVLSEGCLEYFYGHFTQSAHPADPHLIKEISGFPADHRDLPYRKRGQEMRFFTGRDPRLPVGFALAGGHL